MKVFKLLIPALLLSLTSCYGDYTHDYEKPNMGFAVAKPLRTVIADRDMSIYIGVAIGGKREVDMNDWAKFTIDASLLEGTNKVLLPSSYYTLGDPDCFRVRKSNLPVADVEIKFTDAFYNDPLCLTDHYALPFRMTENSIGGETSIRGGAETTVAVIKYISTYAGFYYRMGSVTEVDAAGNPLGEAVKYGNTTDIIKSTTVEFSSLAPRTVTCPGVGDEGASVGSLTLAMNAERGVTVSGVEGKAAISNATGSYQLEGDHDYAAELGKKAPQFNLQYIYAKGDKYYQVVEQLVLRQDPLFDLRVETW
jgi:hypothetical protein